MNQWQFPHARTLVTCLVTNITEHTFKGSTPASIPSASVVPSRPGLPTQQNAIRRIGERVEPAAPSTVVAQARSRHTAAAPELDPPRFLGAGNPGALDAALLVEAHNVAHGRKVYTFGHVNPDGSGRGNWAAAMHPSEHRVGTVKYCRSCGRSHVFPRYQAAPRELPAEEHWGPAKIATFVVFAIGFVYAIVTIGWVMG